jgi:thiamine biosynthesis lipoprotein
LAKGYAVDVLANYLKSNALESYLIEIGGEIVAQGKSPRFGGFWKIAIEDPQQGDERNFIKTVILKNEALATSGNYRKFAVDENTGLRIAHSINPKTGLAIPSKVLSVSVKAPDCMTADAYATALMVMPLEKSQKLIDSKPELEAYWIVSDSLQGIDELFSKRFTNE